MYCINYSGNYPIFETIELKLFNNARIYDDKESIISILEKSLALPSFNGIHSFDYCSCYPLLGKGRKKRLSYSSWEKIKDLIRQSEIGSVDFAVKRSENALSNNGICFSFDENVLEELGEGMNQFVILITPKCFEKMQNFNLFNFFFEIAEKLNACYGFTNIHIDSESMNLVKECYQKTVEFLPIDCINSNYYEQSCDKIIKDVCWMNFLNNNHIKKSWHSINPILKNLPFYKKSKRGVYFALSDNPYIGEESYKVVRKLRKLFKPVICKDDWYLHF